MPYPRHSNLLEESEDAEPADTRQVPEIHDVRRHLVKCLHEQVDVVGAHERSLSLAKNPHDIGKPGRWQPEDISQTQATMDVVSRGDRVARRAGEHVDRVPPPA